MTPMPVMAIRTIVAVSIIGPVIRPIIAIPVVTMTPTAIVRLLYDTVAALRSRFNSRKTAAADCSSLSAGRGKADPESQRHCQK